MWYNLGKYGQVDGLSLYTDLPGGKVDMEYLDRIIAEAKRVGKVPWCSCEWHEMAAAEITGYRREAREETFKRRAEGG